MSKCCVCEEPAEWIWQPFGPSRSYKCFMLPDWRYHGYSALPVCNACKVDIESGAHSEFIYKEQRYICDFDGPIAIPAYVEDALLWIEETRTPHGGGERAMKDCILGIARKEINQSSARVDELKMLNADLLTACRAALKVWPLSRASLENVTDPQEREAWYLLRAVIRKAEGGEG